MAGQLITLPVRVGLRAARMAAAVGLQASGRAVALVGQVAKVAIPGGSSRVAESPSPPPPPRDSAPSSPPSPPAPDSAPASPPARDRRQPRPRSDAGASAARTSAPPEPALPPRPATGDVPVGSRPTSPPAPLPGELSGETAHISEESELVESFAERGAEDGAGAEVRMAEPWEGYDGMTATDLIVKLQEADAAELAAVMLYEQATRGRETVLTAVDRAFHNRGNGQPN